MDDMTIREKYYEYLLPHIKEDLRLRHGENLEEGRAAEYWLVKDEDGDDFANYAVPKLKKRYGGNYLVEYKKIGCADWAIVLTKRNTPEYGRALFDSLVGEVLEDGRY